MAGAHAVESELLQDGHIFLDQFVCDSVSVVGILHVRTLCIHLQRFAVEVEHVVAHLRLLESYVLSCILWRVFR